MAGVLDGTAPVIGYTTVMEAHLLAGLAYRGLGDQRAANRAAEQALTLAEQDRLVLPFVMTGSTELLEALPRHETAHAALLADILDLVHGSSLAAKDQSAPPVMPSRAFSRALSSSAAGADSSAVTVVIPVLLAAARGPVEFGPNGPWCLRSETMRD